MAASPPDANLGDPASCVSFGMSMVIKSLKLKFSGVKNVDTTTVYNWLKPDSDTDVILLDSRPEEEFNISHIAGSVPVDWKSDNMADVLNKIPNLNEKSEVDKKKAIVCYCSVGYRSSAIAQKLQSYLDTQEATPKIPVYNMEGALFQWANEHRPMVDVANQKTVFAHPFNAVWGKLLNKDLRKSPSQ